MIGYCKLTCEILGEVTSDNRNGKSSINPSSSCPGTTTCQGYTVYAL